jgi:Uri superfamily endonuclease
MLPEAGTYALFLDCPETREVEVGRLGRIIFEAGTYIYVGSAFGPGGVEARVGRHLRQQKRSHWHIDYVKHLMHAHRAVITHDAQHWEHVWAGLVSQQEGAWTVEGFGCSDCRCPSHLYYWVDSPPRPDSLAETLSEGCDIRVTTERFC